jgi:hypothetical protein
MPKGGAVRYTQMAVHTPAGKAAAMLRAGFKLVPKSGTAIAALIATKIATNHPVRDAHRGEFVATKTIIINRKVSAASANQATPMP